MELALFQFAFEIYTHNTRHIPQAIVSSFWSLTDSTLCSLALTLLCAAAPLCCHGGRGRYSRAGALPSTAPCNALCVMLSVGCKAMDTNTQRGNYATLHALTCSTTTIQNQKSHHLQTLAEARHGRNKTAIHGTPRHICGRNLRAFWHKALKNTKAGNFRAETEQYTEQAVGGSRHPRTHSYPNTHTAFLNTPGAVSTEVAVKAV